MSVDKLKLEVLLAAIDKVTRPLKVIENGSKETSAALKAAKDQLRALNEQQKRVDGFRAAARGIAIHRQELAKAEERVRSIKQAMESAQYPTKAMQQAFKQATTEANNLKGNITRLTEKQERLRRELSASGVDTHKLAGYQRDLKAQMASATVEVDKQSEALAELNKRASTLRAARYAYDKGMEQRGRLKDGGIATIAAGIAIGAPVAKAVKDYASFEDAMLGVARQVDGARDANGRLTQTYYDMGESIKAMSERIPLATTEIAAIVEAGARMGIKGKENLLAYAETTAIMASAFDLPVDQVGEDVAKIAALYKVPIKSIGDLGDVINYLDDATLAKGGDIIDVMKRIAGTADTVGMKYKEAAALASTFLSLGANAEVAGSASNAIMTNLSIATMQPEKFQGGLAMLRMTAKEIQQGMATDATGTILKVLDAIKALPKEKQLEATTRLFGKEFGDDASKLAANIGEYRKQLELVNDAQAKGSMSREAEARNQALSAQYEMSKSAVFNLTSALGEKLKPALVDIMGSVRDVLRGLRDWMTAHPNLTSALVKGAAVISLIVIGIGALLIAIAGVLGPMLALRYGMALIGIKGFGLVGVVRNIGSAFLWLGRALLMNPLGLAITALAGAAYLIYKNWEPIKEFFSNLWDGITERFHAVVEWFKDRLSFLKPILSLLFSPAKLAAAGFSAAMAATPAQAVKIDNRPPITSQAARTAQASGPTTIHVHPAPGMNEQQLADLVARKMDERDRQRAAAARSSLRDRE
jgi:TP901 family phage tail tape measure protein